MVFKSLSTSTSSSSWHNVNLSQATARFLCAGSAKFMPVMCPAQTSHCQGLLPGLSADPAMKNGFACKVTLQAS
jgi:hypothetical protein